MPTMNCTAQAGRCNGNQCVTSPTFYTTEQPESITKRFLTQVMFYKILVITQVSIGHLGFNTGASDELAARMQLRAVDAGVKAPYSHGATDDFGYQAVDQIATIYDLHATMLHLMGLDHTRLSFYHNGIERRLTDVHGHVLEPILA